MQVAILYDLYKSQKDILSLGCKKHRKTFENL